MQVNSKKMSKIGKERGRVFLKKVVFGGFLLAIFALVSSPGFAVQLSTLDSGASNANSASEACSGLQELGVDCSAGSQSAQEVAAKPINSIINTLSIVVGAAAVIMLIVGGFKFITSSGDSEGTKKARNTIIYAAVGLLIVLIAQSIIHFVFNQANNLQKTSNPAAPTSVLIIDKDRPTAIS